MLKLMWKYLQKRDGYKTKCSRNVYTISRGYYQSEPVTQTNTHKLVTFKKKNERQNCSLKCQWPTIEKTKLEQREITVTDHS